ncbi:hypothetical protein [Chryseobacterium defluvii]|uniref:Immunity protein 26 of polymorphic toxin system n=1 Tax=Chryseobacterium defluvii TaxID=160396 RepID=A0A495SN86_9FLAO|nr:hypothetical protein [Chryseobacterium defluvii]RKT01779.1 hypothetical protein BCF58_1004 [Chryseobacterium defluvii]
MKNFELGSVYAIDTVKGIGIFQLVNIPEDKRHGVEMIRVSYDLYTEVPKSFQPVFDQDFFYIRFPVKAALKRKMINYIGHSDLIPGFKIPRYYRTPHYFNRDEWIIFDSETNQIEQVKTLTVEQLKLSTDSVWNIAFLKERLEEGWRLENWK